MGINIKKVFIGAAFVVNVFNTVFQKVIIVIVKDQMIFIETSLCKKCFCLFPKKSHPAHIPGIEFISSMYDGAAGKDQKTIAFF